LESVNAMSDSTITYQQNKQGFEVYLVELNDVMIEAPKATYDAAPPDRRDDPAYWRECLVTPSSVAIEPIDDELEDADIFLPDVTHVCRTCKAAYRYSADDLAWKFEAFPLAPCGDPWKYVVPFIQLPWPQTHDDARMERATWSRMIRGRLNQAQLRGGCGRHNDD
jgi:hypothetical protein